MADGHPLTIAETWAAHAIFGNEIVYRTVVVHRGKYVFLQPDDTAMTPNGEIYFSEPVYKADFATTVGDRAWLVHELTHVWQYQHGVNVILAAPFSRNYTYGKITARTRFADLNIEQQAALVADYYLIGQGQSPFHGSGTLADYRAVVPFWPVP